jgi:hypothetical protein
MEENDSSVGCFLFVMVFVLITVVLRGCVFMYLTFSPLLIYKQHLVKNN